MSDELCGYRYPVCSPSNTTSCLYQYSGVGVISHPQLVNVQSENIISTAALIYRSTAVNTVQQGISFDIAYIWHEGLGLTIVIFTTKCTLHSSGLGTPPCGITN